MYQFHQKLKFIKEKVKLWNKDHFKNIHLEKQQIESQLENIQIIGMKEGYNDSINKEGKDLLEALEARYSLEEILWKTKCRNICLREGERNSSFFFKATLQHRKSNTIVILNTDNGNEVNKQEDLEFTLTNHFKKLMKEPDIYKEEERKEILDNIPSLVPQEKMISFSDPLTWSSWKKRSSSSKMTNPLEHTASQLISSMLVGPPSRKRSSTSLKTPKK